MYYISVLYIYFLLLGSKKRDTKFVGIVQNGPILHELSDCKDNECATTFLSAINTLLTKRASTVSVTLHEEVPAVSALKPQEVHLLPGFDSIGDLMNFIRSFKPTHIILDRESRYFYNDCINLLVAMSASCTLIMTEVMERKFNDFGLFIYHCGTRIQAKFFIRS